MNWRSARLFDGSLFLSSGATTNELTVRSFPFGSRPVGFPPLGLEEGRYFRTRDERGVSWSCHASPRPRNVRSIAGDLFDLGRGGSRLDPPLRNHSRTPVPPDPPRLPFRSHPNAFCPRGRVWGVLIHISGADAPATRTPSAKTRHDRSLFDPNIDTHKSRRAGAPASKSNKRNTSAQQASFEREKKRGEGPRGSRAAASEGTTRESGRKRNGSAIPKNKRRTKGEEGGCLIPRSLHERSSTSETERKRKQTGWKTCQDCAIRSEQVWEEWKKRPNRRKRFETKRALLLCKGSAR